MVNNGPLHSRQLHSGEFVASGSLGSQLLIFVNGYTKGPKFLNMDCLPGKPYWGPELLKKALVYFPNSRILDDICFVNGEGSALSGAKTRMKAGNKFMTENWERFRSKLMPNEAISFVTHSMGGSFAEGMIEVLLNKGVPINKVLHLSAADASGIDISNSPQIERLQINVTGDKTLLLKDPLFYNAPINGIKTYGLVDWSLEKYHPNWLEQQIQKGKNKPYWDAHYDTKHYDWVFDWAHDLEASVPVVTKFTHQEADFSTLDGASSDLTYLERRVYYVRYDLTQYHTRYESMIKQGKKLERIGPFSPRADKYLGEGITKLS